MDNLHRTREPNEVNLSAMLGQHGNSLQLTKTLGLMNLTPKAIAYM